MLLRAIYDELSVVGPGGTGVTEACNFSRNTDCSSGVERCEPLL